MNYNSEIDFILFLIVIIGCFLGIFIGAKIINRWCFNFFLSARDKQIDELLKLREKHESSKIGGCGNVQNANRGRGALYPDGIDSSRIKGKKSMECLENK